MKRLLLLALAAAFAACNPSVPVGPDNSTKFVVAEFDPAHGVIPLPNDLVFLDANGNVDTRLHAPETGGTDAQNEFNRDYLNHLDGFPMESAASVLFDKPIDENSIVLYDGNPTGGANVAIFDVTGNAPVTTINKDTSPGPNGGQYLNLIPKGGYWTRGHQYAVLVLGGANGVKGAESGQTVTGSPTWGLVVSSQPLVVCDNNGQNCRPATSAIPTTERDPARAFAQQLATARQLEALRKNYAIILGPATALIPGLKATDIAIVWTFTITSQAEVTYDPGHSIIPFPNDALNPTQKQVALPIPPDAGALITQLYEGLNTLDGFSTTAPIVSENGPDIGALVQGKLPGPPYALSASGPINMLPIGKVGGAGAGTNLDAFACVSCTVSPILLDGGVKPDTLEIVPRLPLNERTTYAAYITTDLTDSTRTPVIASPAFALTRSSAPLYDGTHSTVSLLTDDQAKQLDQLRSALKPLFDNLAAGGIPRQKLALLWVFTTQSTVSPLADLHLAPTQAGLPTAPTYLTAAFTPQIKAGLGGQGIPTANIGNIYMGGMVDLFALVSPVGTFTPGLAGATPVVIPFVMAAPDTSVCLSSNFPNGYPVTIFGHGLTGNRNNALAIANALAGAPSCQVTIAIDEPWHGERNTCTGFGGLLDAADPAGAPHPDNLACANPATMACTGGRCVADANHQASRAACVPGDQTNGDAACLIQSQGVCVPDSAGAATGHCEGGTFGSSIAGVPISGWNILNLANFFATRDNFRQQVISNGQFIRVLEDSTNTGLGARSLQIDPSRISYGGQSLGGILGTISMAYAPEVGNVMLNVPGADLPLILLTSPSFDKQKQGFLAALASQGIEQNSPLYDQFLGIAKWIIDPADPANAGWYLTHQAKIPARPANISASRRAFMQWILGDQVVVNPATVELVQAATANSSTDGVKITVTGDAPFWAYQFNGSSTPFSFNTAALPECSDPNNHPGNRHGFLLRPPSATCGGPPDVPNGVPLTTNAQTQAVEFLNGLAPF